MARRGLLGILENYLVKPETLRKEIERQLRGKGILRKEAERERGFSFEFSPTSQAPRGLK